MRVCSLNHKKWSQWSCGLSVLMSERKLSELTARWRTLSVSRPYLHCFGIETDFAVRHDIWRKTVWGWLLIRERLQFLKSIREWPKSTTWGDTFFGRNDFCKHLSCCSFWNFIFTVWVLDWRWREGLCKSANEIQVASNEQTRQV